ncbi:hypothetical protein KFK09_012411 [Dendrobium nobile]|uniref:Uncharacterized protein n=1 Tax=Dendrobium nobile TaxID=94219 RepID=A0A8T3BF84_DENNO|nr:hypothetical protein KFK09_012411 [Dendrobium nobile]
MKLKLEDSNLITEMNSDNSDLILDSSDGDLANLRLNVSQSNLSHDSSETEPTDLRIETKPDFTLENSTLSLKSFEPNLNNEPPFVSLEFNFGAATWNLYLTTCVIPDFSLTIVPTDVLGTFSHLISPMPADESLRYPLMDVSQDQSSYFIPDSYFLPVIAPPYHDEDHLYPSWINLFNYTTPTRRLPTSLTETSH